MPNPAKPATPIVGSRAVVPKKLLKKQGFAPHKLKSYNTTKKELLPVVGNRQHKDLNNRAESLHQLTRLCEKKMRRVKLGQAQKPATSELIYQQTQPKRHLLAANVTKLTMLKQMQVWRQIIVVSVSIYLE